MKTNLSLKIIYAFTIALVIKTLLAEKIEASEASEASEISATFVEVKAGTFQMGSPLDEKDRYPDENQHLVTLSQDFQIQTTEVTQFQYFSVMGYNPSHFKQEGYCKEEHRVTNNVPLCPNYPVDKVSWNDVQDFISQLNQECSKYTYRLPTEAEWEYTARGCLGSHEPRNFAHCTTTAFNLGDHISTDQINFDGNHNSNDSDRPFGTYRRQTVNVESLPNANALGLYNMHGNVWEWVQDKYEKYSTRSNIVDPQGDSWLSLRRVIRGGCWSCHEAHTRSARRGYVPPLLQSRHVGFRLVRTVRAPGICSHEKSNSLTHSFSPI